MGDGQDKTTSIKTCAGQHEGFIYGYFTLPDLPKQLSGAIFLFDCSDSMGPSYFDIRPRLQEVLEKTLPLLEPSTICACYFVGVDNPFKQTVASTMSKNIDAFLDLVNQEVKRQRPDRVGSFVLPPLVHAAEWSKVIGDDVVPVFVFSDGEFFDHLTTIAIPDMAHLRLIGIDIGAEPYQGNFCSDILPFVQIALPDQIPHISTTTTSAQKYHRLWLQLKWQNLVLLQAALQAPDTHRARTLTWTEDSIWKHDLDLPHLESASHQRWSLLFKALPLTEQWHIACAVQLPEKVASQSRVAQATVQTCTLTDAGILSRLQNLLPLQSTARENLRHYLRRLMDQVLVDTPSFDVLNRFSKLCSCRDQDLSTVLAEVRQSYPASVIQQLNALAQQTSGAYLRARFIVLEPFEPSLDFGTVKPGESSMSCSFSIRANIAANGYIRCEDDWVWYRPDSFGRGKTQVEVQLQPDHLKTPGIYQTHLQIGFQQESYNILVIARMVEL